MYDYNDNILEMAELYRNKKISGYQELKGEGNTGR